MHQSNVPNRVGLLFPIPANKAPLEALATEHRTSFYFKFICNFLNICYNVVKSKIDYTAGYSKYLQILLSRVALKISR
jgi:hypothetical protein